nr:PlmF [Aspergillus flavipes]
MSITWRENTNADAYAALSRDRVYNGRLPLCLPRAIVRVLGLEDVLSGVALANREQCRLAIRSGGHSLPVWSLHEDAVLLDLGDWKNIDIDLATQRAMVTPAVTSKELDDALSPRGLIFPGGHCPDVGLGGFLLQGGMGWNFQGWGWGCEAVEAVQVVTARGELLWCNSKQHSDLYWAARGAGPAFPAIVVCFQLRVMRSQPQGLWTSTYIFPRHDYRLAFEWCLDVMPIAGENTETKLLSYYPPDSEDNCLLVQFITRQENAADAKDILTRIHARCPPGALMESPVQPSSMDSLFAVQAAANVPGHRCSSDNAFLRDGVDVISLLEPAFQTLPHRRSFAFWSPMVPRSRSPLKDMALSIQSDHYVSLYAVWEDAVDDERCRQWAHGFVQSIEAQSVGSYIGEGDPERRPGRFWTEECFRTLMEVRQRWDPECRLSVCPHLIPKDQS